jgi:hypothetical protein
MKFEIGTNAIRHEPRGKLMFGAAQNLVRLSAPINIRLSHEGLFVLFSKNQNILGNAALAILSPGRSNSKTFARLMAFFFRFYFHSIFDFHNIKMPRRLQELLQELLNLGT